VLDDGSQGYLFSGGSYTAVNVPGAMFTSANGISNSGQIVGTYEDYQYNEHGFLLSEGNYVTFDDPGAVGGMTNNTWANGINSSGQVVGYYNGANPVQGFFADFGNPFVSDESLVRPAARGISAGAAFPLLVFGNDQAHWSLGAGRGPDVSTDTTRPEATSMATSLPIQTHPQDAVFEAWDTATDGLGLFEAWGNAEPDVLAVGLLTAG
jgi:probable HAF family extracellular repeat protein